MPVMNALTTLLSVSLLLSLAGCAVSTGNSTPADGHWFVVELAGQSLAVDAPAPTLLLRFDETELSGTTGCNRYSGPIEADAGSSLRFGPVAATKMACLDGDRMSVERAFLSMLERVRSQRRDGDGDLLLLDERGQVLARLRPGGGEAG